MTTTVASALIRPATGDDLSEIQDILNAEIGSSTASWTTMEKSLDDMRMWFDTRVSAGFPVFVADIDGRVAGYASYGSFRSGEGYARTVEHTVYVDSQFRRLGLARLLIEHLIAHARSAGITRMIGGVSSDAGGSCALHTAMGFLECGRLPGIGHKFGKDLDLILMVYQLD